MGEVKLSIQANEKGNRTRHERKQRLGGASTPALKYTLQCSANIVRKERNLSNFYRRRGGGYHEDGCLTAFRGSSREGL